MQKIILVNAILATLAFAAPIDHVRRDMRDPGHRIAHDAKHVEVKPTCTSFETAMSTGAAMPSGAASPSRGMIMSTGTAPAPKNDPPMPAGRVVPPFSRKQPWATGPKEEVAPTGTRPALRATGTAPSHEAPMHTGTAPIYHNMPMSTGSAPAHHKAPMTSAPLPSEKPMSTGTDPSHKSDAPIHTAAASDAPVSHTTAAAKEPVASETASKPASEASSAPSSQPEVKAGHKSPGSACSSEDKTVCNGPSMYGHCAWTDGGHWRWEWADVEDGSECKQGEVKSIHNGETTWSKNSNNGKHWWSRL